MRETFRELYVRVKSKLSTLKEKFKDGADEAKQKIIDWEKDVERYRLDEEFWSHDKVKQLYAYYYEKARAISKVLSHKEDLEEVERNRLFARRKEIYGFLQMLGKSALADIESLEQTVDFELEGID